MKVKVNQIKVDERYRKDLGDIDELKRSIEEDGLISPIAVRETDNGYELLAGERRLTAVRQLGWPEIEVRLYEGELTELKRKQIELEENINRKDMTWQEEAFLKREIHNLRLAIHGKKTSTSPNADGWSLRDTAKLMGVTHPMITNDIKLAEAVESFPEYDWQNCKTRADAQKQLKKLTKTLTRHDAVEAFEKTKSNKSKFLQEIANSYILGDFFELVKKVPDNFADWVEVDPPYAIDLKQVKKDFNNKYVSYNEIDKNVYPEFLENSLKQCYRILKPSGWAIFWFGPDPWFQPVIDTIRSVGFKCFAVPGLWRKPNGQTMQPNTRLANCYEMFFYAYKSDGALNKPGRSNIFEFPPMHESKKWHPTQRPLELMCELLETFSAPGSQGVVPFLGSGVTLLAAAQTSRNCFGYDNDPNNRAAYIEVINEIYGG
jgi:ParB family chromosome partitioning protein